MDHEFSMSHGSLLQLLWCKLKWQISSENKAPVLPHPPNPQKKLQPGSQWVLTPPAGPSSNSELLLTSVRPVTQNQSCLVGKNWGKRSTGQHQIISVCNFTLLLVLTDLCQGKLWLSLLLSLQTTSLTETSVVFMQGIIFCLSVNRELNLTSLEKSRLNRAFIIVSKHTYNIQGSE